jgi:hypothetical protein
MRRSSLAVPNTTLSFVPRVLVTAGIGIAMLHPVAAWAAGPGDRGPAPAGLVASATTAAPEGAPAAEAQDPAPAADPILTFFKKVELSGLIDTYYTYNFNKPTTGTFTPYRSFDVKHNQFSVALVEFDVTKPATEDDRIGFRFDLQYGQVAQVFNTDPLDNNNLVNVQQGYVSYLAPVGKGLTFEVGKFVTPIGTEPTESNLNNNYSRAFLYQFGPFYHAGARIAYPVSPKVTLGAMVVNGWNATGDNNSGKSIGGSITVMPTPKFTFIQNVLWGPEQTDNADDMRTYSDTNLAFIASDKVTTGLNYIYAKDEVAGSSVNWQAVALYLKGQITPVFALAPRYEWFDDPDGFGFATGFPQKMQEFTLTAEVKHPKGLIMRLEYRRDWSDQDAFIKNGLAVDNQNTFTVGFVLPFSSKNP